MPKFKWVSKVLVLGSGAIKIGEAAEFDYSGSQCLKALREEGIATVLINPNIATIQTDLRLAERVYLLPISPKYVEEVIKRERPDGILLGFGGQTALNCGVQLAERGILQKYGVKVLGTPVRAIEETEDRELFSRTMVRSGIPIPKSYSAVSVEEAVEAARDIGFPVIVRVAYTLGGKGSGVACSEGELRRIVKKALTHSMITQVLVEEYLGHWKEVEYEVMRDYSNNCLTVCNMENVDPMGIHTGDSIVVAPSQTLTNQEYHRLRSASIRIIQSLGIIGECNIQWALNPETGDIRAIEVNARMSRSSALASKATGYPLAYVATKLAIGYLLSDLVNSVTGVTSACFEPALDYVVVKIPRWDMQKFRNVDKRIGPQMKSVGEVMAIGRCFEEALQKAIRMLDIGRLGLVCNSRDKDLGPVEALKKALKNPTDQRLFKIAAALKIGLSSQEVYELSGVDPWFLHKFENIIAVERNLRALSLENRRVNKVIRKAKRLGFSDSQIAICLKTDEDIVREFRRRYGVIPVIKQIDTLAAEWPTRTNYIYLTYGGKEDDLSLESDGRKVMVLGSGVFRIGSSVEFDWCGVNTVWALKKHGVDEVVMVNYNPETVSTDYDVSDKLYFEEINLERILDIWEKEKPLGIVVNVGGQASNNLALKLTERGVKLLGTSGQSIDQAENRSKFSVLLDSLGIPQPEWSRLTTLSEAKEFSQRVGYPVLIRPSYVLSGSAMKVAHFENELEDYLKLAADVSRDQPVVISKFMEDTMEVEVDGVCDGVDALMVVIEHIEKAGVHSGDAIMCIPPQRLPISVVATIKAYALTICRTLGIRGPFNVQYLVKDERVYVIECNLRASRSMPFASKTVGVNLVELAVRIMLGEKLKDLCLKEIPHINHVGVKVPQFSFMRLSEADPILGVEMVSTGEVACLGEDFNKAFLMALQSTQFRLPPPGGFILFEVGDEARKDIKSLFNRLEALGFKVSESKTNESHRNGCEAIAVSEGDETRRPDLCKCLLKKEIDLIICVTKNNMNQKKYDGYKIRRLAVDMNIPVMNIASAWALVKLLERGQVNSSIRSLNEYINRDLCLGAVPVY